MFRNNAVTVVVGSMCALLAEPAWAGGPAVTYRVVAKTGDPAPGGGNFTEFGIPRMNEQGEVSFQADTSAVLFSSGIWSEGVGGPGALAQVVREGAAVPGSGGTLFFGDFTESNFTFFGPEINDRGSVVFGYRILGAGVDPNHSIGIARQVNGTLQNVARPLQLAPGLGGATFLDILNIVNFSDNDEVGLVIDLTGPGINASNDETIWRSNANGTFNLVMREGAAVPGQPGSTYPGTGLVLPQVNDVGELSWVSYLNTPGGNLWTLLRGAPGSPTIVAQEGQQTPLGPGTAFEGGLFSFGQHSINNSGHTLFPQYATIAGQSKLGIWRRLGGVLQAVAVDGQPTPIGNFYTFLDGFTGGLGKDGRVAFRGRATTGGSITDDNNSALFMRFANGATQVIAREGEPAPGLLFGATYDQLDQGITAEFVNDRGQVCYNGLVRGVGVTAGTNYCLWGTRLISGPTLMLREGQVFEAAPGDFRLVSDFRFIFGSGTESGDRTAFNRLGQVAMRLEFSNGTEAIVVATLQDECFGDIDGDLDIDFADLNILLGFFNMQVGTGLNGDLDLDGDVDFADLNLLLSVFNTNCVPM